MKQVNRLITFTMAILLFLGVFPQKTVYANFQHHIEDLNIRSIPSQAGRYNFELLFGKPRAALETEQPPSFAGDVDDINRATDYDISYRNTTMSERFPVTPQVYNQRYEDWSDVNSDPTKKYTHSFTNVSLEGGSIYEYQVIPSHMHKYNVYDPEYGWIAATPARAPYTQGMEPAKAIFLTDILIEGRGSGKNMTVSWQNPTYNGADVFEGYRIYWELGGSEVGSVKDKHIDVKLDDPRLVRLDNQMLQYTFEDPSLMIGTMYAVRVEPLGKGGILVRELNKFIINDYEYPIAYSEREYRANDVYIRPALYVEQQGLESVRIFWDKIHTTRKISKIEVLRSQNETFTPHEMIGVIRDTSAQTINYWTDPVIKSKVWYKIIIYFEDGTNMESEICSYDPFNEDFSPYKPNIFKIVDNNDMPLVMDIEFQAFTRPPYNDEEKGFSTILNGKEAYVDKDLIYYFWVTDEIINFNNPQFIAEYVDKIDAKNLSQHEFTTVDDKGNKVEFLAYNVKLDKYVTTSDQGYETKPLAENKVYYVKIQAERTTAGQMSKEALGSHFIAPTGDISVKPLMSANPPLRIKKDEKGVDVITNDSITIQWDKKWFEVYDDKTKSWYSKIGIDSKDSKFVFGKEAESADKSYYLNDLSDVNMSGALENLKDVLKGLGGDTSQTALMAVRLMDLTGSLYEIHVVDYDYMSESETYESYLEKLSNDVYKWQGIESQGDDPDHPEYKVIQQHSPTDGPLIENTAYVIFFRPYIIKDGKKNAYYPNYVTGTTLSDRDVIPTVPVVPTIDIVSSTETSITVRWNYAQALQYELKFSDKMTDYPQGGTVIKDEEIMKTAEIKTENEKTYLYYTVEGLFPKTLYYFWVRSYSTTNPQGTTYSLWSNPASGYTEDVEIPIPPRGLWLATKEYVDIYNKENDTKYVNRDSKYFILEWSRNAEDLYKDGDGSLSATSTDGTANLLSSENIRRSFMVKFDKLISNRKYYARAKTIVELSREGEGIKKSYYYLVQISLTPDFKDFTEIYVPGYTPKPDGNGIITRESEWCSTIEISTGKTDDEYDGNEEDLWYPLPDEDFELIYDSATRSLTYRFRSAGKDANGNNDNSVDQRFISRLVANRVFTFDANVSMYGNRLIETRSIQLPYSVYSAFSERKISLKMVANNMNIIFPSNALNTAEFKNISDFGKDAFIIFTLKEDVSLAPPLASGNSYISKPQTLSIQVVTASRRVTLTDFAEPILVELKADNKNLSFTRNVSAHISNKSDKNWQHIDSDYDATSNIMKIETYVLGSYGVISTKLPTYGSGTTSSDLQTVVNRLNIKDINQFSESEPITSNQFNNLISGIAEGKYSISINEPMSNDTYESLGKSGMLISGNHVSREAGINALVKLYEKKQSASIKNYMSIETTSHSDISMADTAYQIGLLKAEQVGFFDNSIRVEPKRNMTIGEVIYIINIIIQDTMQ